MPATTTLGVTRKFQIAKCQIAVALDADGFNSIANDWREELPVFFHDELVGLADVGKRTSVGNPQNQRIVETAGTLQNRAAAGTASQDRYPVLPGLVEIGLRADFI